MEFTVNTSIPIQFEELNTVEDSRFVKAKIWICHTGLNLNNSSFDKPTIEDAISSLSNIPILGFVQSDSLNNSDFRGHEQRIVINNNGVEVEYLGRAYGLVPESNNAQFELKMCDDGVEREFLTAEVLLWTKFPEASNIVERDQIKNQSMELHPPSIQGAFSKEGHFNFTKFKFEGLCLLGDGVTPAMKGSILEKFAEIKNQTNFSKMITEFNTYFSQYQNKNLQHDVVDVANESNNEGGDNVNEKLELFTKYSTLSDEDVAELKANIENYSIEELEEKLNELSELTKIEQEEPDASLTFSLTAQQMEQEIRKALSAERYVDRWQDSSRSYYYIDHDENRVYAEDAQSTHTPVGINYTVSGDFVTIDFSTKKRVKFVPQDMEDGADVVSSFVSLERNEFDIEVTKIKTEEETKATFTAIQSELDEIKPQFEKLQESNLELDGKVKAFEAINTSELAIEVEDLRSYKAAKEQEDKLIVVEKFSQLSDEDLQPFKDNLDKFTLEDLELQLFAIVGKKGLSFSATSNKSTDKNLIFSLSNIESTNTNLPAWAEYVDQYKSKQK